MAQESDRPGLGKGYVQVYTGDGKGKTTAALGLALRAAGAGLRVFIGQFIKGRHYSEVEALQRFADLITLEQFGRGCFIHREPSPADIDAARRGLDRIRQVLASGDYAVVILDEANVAVRCGLFSIDDLLTVIDAAPANVERIVTGRNAHAKLVARADLVTEMAEVKHYFTQGVDAREGIEK